MRTYAKSLHFNGLFPLKVQPPVAVETVALFGPAGGKEGKILVVVLGRPPVEAGGGILGGDEAVVTAVFAWSLKPTAWR